MLLFLVILLFGLLVFLNVGVWLIFGALPYLSQLGSEGGSLSENMVLFSLGLIHEITNGVSCMQHIHVHTPSGDQCQSLLSYFKPFRSLQCPHINQKKFKAGKGSQIAPSHRSDRSLRLPLSCRIAESSPHSHILVSSAAREAASVRIWY